MSADQVRPTKKQRELLAFIESFIAQHGYSPSYREIMTGLEYTSVATVALHVNSLIKRGHLRRRDGKARSLEVVAPQGAAHASNPTQPSAEHWLVARVDQLFSQYEQAETVVNTAVAELRILMSALKVLGLEEAAKEFIPRLADLKVRADQADDISDQ